MDAAQRQLYDQIDDATQRLLGTARVIAEPDLRQPSLLPGWTRAHVLAHLARNSDAMRALLVGAGSGQDRPAYASSKARDADIERDAAQGAKDLVADVADSAMALRTVARQLPDQAWAYPVRVLDSAPFPAGQLLTRPGRGLRPGRLAGHLRVPGAGGADAHAAPGPAQPAAGTAGQRAPAPPRAGAGTAKERYRSPVLLTTDAVSLFLTVVNDDPEWSPGKGDSHGQA
jgi:hypothetical protein